MAAAAEVGTDEGEPFLAAVADPDRGSIPFRVAVVVAHPDDETIGLGALLGRLEDVKIIHVTDGAPVDGFDSAAHGFENPTQYGAARRSELETAMEIAGIGGERLESLGCPDQQASFRLVPITTELAMRLAGVDAVLTHAYEGGHPDHDAVAFAVHAACRLLERAGRAPAVIEFPLYRARGSDGADDWEIASFVPQDDSPELAILLTPAERLRKRSMFGAYLSQIDLLARFPLDREVIRPAPRVDFSRLPNSGHVLYDRQNWGLTGERWLELAKTALFEIEMETVP